MSYASSITGRFVKKAAAVRWPRTTVEHRRPRQITAGLAVCLAGQVVIGLALEERDGDAPSIRADLAERMNARAALSVIGLMLSNATEDPQALEVLGLALNPAFSVTSQTSDGGRSISMRPSQ